MTKPRLVKVRALFYVLQHIIKRGCAYFDTAPLLDFAVWLSDPGEARTLDPVIKSHLLYQLSYGVIFNVGTL